MEDFDITNESDARATNLEIDSEIEKGLDKNILNGLKVPASTMNSLSEDEYARSVTTTNLFFAMDVAIDQDIVINDISDLLRKYARYSEEFQQGLIKLLPQLGSTKGTSSTDEVSSAKTEDKEKATGLPDDYTMEMLIDDMTISLPHPNVAPSKAQFEALEAMVTAITSTVSALAPDELTGGNEELRAPLAILRARYVVENIRTYLKSSGMSSLTFPDNDVSSSLGSIQTLHNGLFNLGEMIKANASLGKTEEPVTPTPEGY